MPTPPPDRLLTTTARSTFESLALLFAEPAAAARDAAGALGPGAVGARVAFTGAVRGEAVEGALVVRVSGDVAAALAENMLGVSAADAPARRDAVGELANVVCGHVVSAAAGPDAVFRLAAPEHVPPVAPGAGPGAGAWCAWLDVEGGRACVALDAPAALFAAGAP